MTQDSALSPQPALLGFLMSGPQHGYELHQKFSHDLGQVWRIGRSQLYAQLKQLAECGLISVRTEVQSSRPPRKVYHLNPAGRVVFLEWLYQPTPHLRHIRLEFLTRLFFFRRFSMPGFDQLAASQKELLRSRVESIDHTAATSDDDFRQLVLKFRQGQLEAAIRWLDHCLETL